MRDHVQSQFKAVALLGLHQGGGRLFDVLDVGDQYFGVLSEPLATPVEQPFHVSHRVGQLAVGVGELLGEAGQVTVERDKLLIAFMQRVDEQRKAVHDPEKITATLVEGVHRLRQCSQPGVELLALAG